MGSPNIHVSQLNNRFVFFFKNKCHPVACKLNNMLIPLLSAGIDNGNLICIITIATAHIKLASWEIRINIFADGEIEERGAMSSIGMSVSDHTIV